MSVAPAETRPFRLVIFDWDGTLIDSVATIVACTNAMLEELGVGQAPERTIRSMIGGGLIESIRRFAPDDEQFYQRVVATYQRLWFEDYHARSTLFEGAREMLESLAGDGYLLAIATAKSRRGLIADLERLELDGLFDASRTADDTPSKPHPAMLLEILDELGVGTGDALMIGDTTHDVQMGHNASVAVVAVASGAESEQALRALAPAGCLPSVAELPIWLAARHRDSPESEDHDSVIR
jgi:phosphoglycolate phosphatase